MFPTYPDLIENLSAGVAVPSRFGLTREWIGEYVSARADEFPSRLGMNVNLGMMEMLQLIAGVFDLGAIRRVAPNANHSLFSLSMSYGPRLAAEIPLVIEALRRDPVTRQAVLHVAKGDDRPGEDPPCTTSIQFIYRGALSAIVSMRSWDAVKGLPYDLMMFGGLTQAVARSLGVMYGQIKVMAGSLHIYESDFERVPNHYTGCFYLPSLASWDAYVAWAADAIRRAPDWPNKSCPGVRFSWTPLPGAKVGLPEPVGVVIDE